MSDVLPTEFYHPEWRGKYDNPDHNTNLIHANLNSTAESWAVWLEFKAEGNRSMGSGFFIDMPDLEHHKLILTAAHNLIDPKRNDTQDLEVFSQGNKLEVVDTWCCPLYRASQSPEYDYAAIKVKRTAQISDCRGFVFAMGLGDVEHLSGDAYVTGYRNTMPRQPTTSMGPLVACFGKEKEMIEYRVVTEQGISGSCVWIGYDGYPTAIAVHNRRPVSKRGGSRGSRLTPKVLREVFQWVGVGKYGVKLRAQAHPGKQTSELPPEGLYLYFSSEDPSALVKRGNGSEFDVLPAQIAANTSKVHYVLCYQGKWVLFDAMQQNVLLHNHVNDRCLFYEERTKKGPVAIVMTFKPRGKDFQLRVQGEMIYGTDDDDSESSEVSLIEYPAGKTPFSLFKYE